MDIFMVDIFKPHLKKYCGHIAMDNQTIFKTTITPLWYRWYHF